MKHDIDVRELYFQQVLWETQTYLRDVLEENDRLRRAMIGLETENGRLSLEKSRLERLAGRADAPSSPRIRLVWND